MRKQKKNYREILEEAVKERRGQLDSFIKPMIEVTANAWEIYDNICNELKQTGMTIVEIGSTGQPMRKLHPLLAQKEKEQRSLSILMKQIGLTYDIDPVRVREADAGNESYPMDVFLAGESQKR